MTVTMTRLLPDAMKLTREILQQCGAPASADVPPNLREKSPRFTVFRSGGVSSHLALVDRPTMQISAWGLSYEQARDLAETGRSLLWQAAAGVPGWNTINGRLNRLTEILGPTEVRTVGQPDDVWRFDFTHRLTVRPYDPDLL